MLLSLFNCEIIYERIVIEMGRKSNYETGLYSELKKLNKKLD